MGLAFFLPPEGHWRHQTEMLRQSELPIVFVVDDELDIAKTLAVVLRMNSYDARAFADPGEALAAVVHAPPQYLISDIGMPNMSGIELAIAMCELHPACKVLLFSSQIGAEEQVEAAVGNCHNFGYAEKPMHPLKLVEKLRSL